MKQEEQKKKNIYTLDRVMNIADNISFIDAFFLNNHDDRIAIVKENGSCDVHDMNDGSIVKILAQILDPNELSTQALRAFVYDQSQKKMIAVLEHKNKFCSNQFVYILQQKPYDSNIDKKKRVPFLQGESIELVNSTFSYADPQLKFFTVYSTEKSTYAIILSDQIEQHFLPKTHELIKKIAFHPQKALCAMALYNNNYKNNPKFHNKIVVMSTDNWEQLWEQKIESDPFELIFNNRGNAIAYTLPCTMFIQKINNGIITKVGTPKNFSSISYTKDDTKIKGYNGKCIIYNAINGEAIETNDKKLKAEQNIVFNANKTVKAIVKHNKIEIYKHN